MAANLHDAVPLLTDYQNLEAHFEWIVDGSIKSAVKNNLPRELKFLEKYLLSIGQESRGL
jgi:hypothetical protein